MHTLWHFRLCPLSRSIRMALSESGIACALVEEKPWDWQPKFLDINPAAELPVLQLDDGQLLCGTYAISEFIAEEGISPSLDDTAGSAPIQLFPGTREDRAEVRRLVDWFNGKMNREVTREFLYERVYSRMAGGSRHTPDVEMLRAIRSNLRYHLSYIGFLAYQRRWLAGDAISFADLAAAAHLSTIDYLGEVPWDENPAAKDWYMRVKSRPSLRAILADRVPGSHPPAHYGELDF
jgi:glutathione S-transferase